MAYDAGEMRDDISSRRRRHAGAVLPENGVFRSDREITEIVEMMATADSVARHGAVGLRGGAFKPRTSPYSFQGLQWAGLELD